MAVIMMNSELEDTEAYIPRGLVLVTPERANKGDMTIVYDDCGRIKFAQAKINNVLNWLFDNSKISEENHHDAIIFSIWRDIHRASRGQKKAVSSGNGESLEIRLRAYGFILLLRQLNNSDCNYIDAVINIDINKIQLANLYPHIRGIKASLDVLTAKIEPIRCAIAYLESMDEVSRIEDSESNLKKLIADIDKFN